MANLLQPIKMTCLVKAMIEAFEPDWAIVQGYKFLDFVQEWSGIPQYSPQKAFLGWITYFADNIGNLPADMPVYSRVRVEKRYFAGPYGRSHHTPSARSCDHYAGCNSELKRSWTYPRMKCRRPESDRLRPGAGRAPGRRGFAHVFLRAFTHQ